LLIVPQALLSALFLGLLGLLAAAFLGLRGGEISRHITFGFFSAMLTMLAHSMMMFYLIGKGKAVKEAMAEHHVTGNYYARIAAARKPVFSIASLAMVVTIIAAILGASVDTGVLPPIVQVLPKATEWSELSRPADALGALSAPAPRACSDVTRYRL